MSPDEKNRLRCFETTSINSSYTVKLSELAIVVVAKFVHLTRKFVGIIKIRSSLKMRLKFKPFFYLITKGLVSLSLHQVISEHQSS